MGTLRTAGAPFEISDDADAIGCGGKRWESRREGGDEVSDPRRQRKTRVDGGDKQSRRNQCKHEQDDSDPFQPMLHVAHSASGAPVVVALMAKHSVERCAGCV